MFKHITSATTGQSPLGWVYRMSQNGQLSTISFYRKVALSVLCPKYLQNARGPPRTPFLVKLPKSRTTAHLHSFIPLFSRLWTQLSNSLWSHSSLQVFRTAFHHHLRSFPIQTKPWSFLHPLNHHHSSVYFAEVPILSTPCILTYPSLRASLVCPSPSTFCLCPALRFVMVCPDLFCVITPPQALTMHKKLKKYPTKFNMFFTN